MHRRVILEVRLPNQLHDKASYPLLKLDQNQLREEVDNFCYAYGIQKISKIYNGKEIWMVEWDSLRSALKAIEAIKKHRIWKALIDDAPLTDIIYIAANSRVYFVNPLFSEPAPEVALLEWVEASETDVKEVYVCNGFFDHDL